MPSNLNLDFYYGTEADQYSFYRIPKPLLTDPRYKSVSIEAKVLYGLLLDRMGLSVKNGWMDSEKRVYIYFTQEDAMNLMSCGKDKATKLFRELDKDGIGLIERKKQGQGRPTRIYVKNFILPPDLTVASSASLASPQAAKLTRYVAPSPPTKIASLDFRGDPGRSKNRMRMDEMDGYRERIRENIGYDLLLLERPYDAEEIDGYVELMAETCASRREYIRVNGEDVPIELVRKRFLKLDGEHIRYVMDSLRQNTTQVVNIRAYTLAALYNAPVTISQYYTAQVSHDMAQGFGGA